jgi:hypothetical protein
VVAEATSGQPEETAEAAAAAELRMAELTPEAVRLFPPAKDFKAVVL